jgi:hypothetical protein
VRARGLVTGSESVSYLKQVSDCEEEKIMPCFYAKFFLEL